MTEEELVRIEADLTRHRGITSTDAQRLAKEIRRCWEEMAHLSRMIAQAREVLGIVERRE